MRSFAPDVAGAKHQVNGRRLAVTAGTAAHLVELHRAEGHVVEHDVTDVGQVHALAKGTRRDDAGELSGAEGVLHAVALGTGKARDL